MTKGAHDLEEVRALIRERRYLLTKTKARMPILEALGGDFARLDAFVAAVAEALDDGFWYGTCLLLDGRVAAEYIQQLPTDVLDVFGLGEEHRHWYVKLLVDRDAEGRSVAFISMHPPTKAIPFRILNAYPKRRT